MDDRAETSKQAKLKNSILSEDGTLKYDFMISLQKIATAKIASSLWMNENTQQRIMDLYEQCHYEVDLFGFFDIKNDIVAKVSQLSLPNAIRKDLKDLVCVLGGFIFDWISYHDEHIFNSKYCSVHLIHNIMWTARGKIDYLQTAKSILMKMKNGLSDEDKYKLACTYCLHDEIALLSSKWPEKNYVRDTMVDKDPVVYFWTARIADDMSPFIYPPYYDDEYDVMSVNDIIMHLLIMDDEIISDPTLNDIPIRYMWNKLSEEEKVENITLLFRNVHNPDFIISALSNLDFEQQQIILKECSDAVLCAILNDWWWWGKYFLPTALNVLDIMDPPSFWKILCELNRKKNKSPDLRDHFKSIFNLLWQKSSTQLKEYIFHNELYQLQTLVIRELHWE